MLFAIIEGHGQIDNGITRKRSMRKELLYALIDSRNMLPGHDSSDDGIDKFISFAAALRIELDRDFAELSSAARLLFVAVTRIGVGLDRFSEWNARRDDLHVNFITFLQSLNDNIDMIFALPRNEC